MVGNNAEWAKEIATNMPAANVAPVVCGKWVARYVGTYAYPVFECSVCKGVALLGFGREHIMQTTTAYCPNCGAKMTLDHP